MAGLLSYRVDIPQEGGLTLDHGAGLDARISTFPTIRGERVAVRLLPTESDVRTLGELGLSDALIQTFVEAAAERSGMILVTGPAGSGKTTTLYALLRHLQATMPGTSLMTVEDPVEFRLDGIAQIQVTPHGELTYARALRSLLRQDPEVILIGEIRDAETAAIATEAALTGHLILTTMHSGRAVDAIVRLLEMGVAPYQCTSTLRLITCQRLIRTFCSQCGGRSSCASADDTETTETCDACLNIGYHGRTACAESVTMGDDLRAAIREGADSRRLAETIAARPEHVHLAADAERHLSAGRTSREEVEALSSSRASDESVQAQEDR